MTPDTLWDRWRDLTRFLESTRISFEKERQYWSGVPHEQRPATPLRSEHLGGRSVYEISVTDHLRTIWDESVLCQSVLIFSFALAEAAALDRLGLDPDNDHGGIESGGTRFFNGLERTGVTSTLASLRSSRQQSHGIRLLTRHRNFAKGRSTDSLRPVAFGTRLETRCHTTTRSLTTIEPPFVASCELRASIELSGPELDPQGAGTRRRRAPQPGRARS